MSIFVYDVEIPKNTPKGKSLVVEAPLERGVIHKFDVQFPAGAQGLAGVRVLKSGQPLFPSNPNEWFVSDNETITFPEYFDLTDTLPKVEIHAYNEDDTYDHTITLRFGVLPREVLG